MSSYDFTHWGGRDRIANIEHDVDSLKNTGTASTSTLSQILANGNDAGGTDITGVGDLTINGLTGATAGARFVGGTTSGPPVSGTFAVRDFVVDGRGTQWICVTAGTPGTWACVSAYTPVNTQTADYTLALTDIGLIVEMNVATANTLTVPPNSSVAFPVGSVVSLFQVGAGQTFVTAGSGVTIISPGSKLKLTGQYSSAALRKRDTDQWVLTGDLAA